MTAATKVSSCVDCATPIIGERLRCPACHDLHAARMVAAGADAGDDAATAPRQRVRVANRRAPGASYPWRAAIEVVGIIGLALFLLAKGCS